jgi:hypothetical protein
MKYARSKGKIFVCFLDSVFSCKKKKKEAAIYDTLRNERKMTDRRSRRGGGMSGRANVREISCSHRTWE